MIEWKVLTNKGFEVFSINSTVLKRFFFLSLNLLKYYNNVLVAGALFKQTLFATTKVGTNPRRVSYLVTFGPAFV